MDYCEIQNIQKRELVTGYFLQMQQKGKRIIYNTPRVANERVKLYVFEKLEFCLDKKEKETGNFFWRVIKLYEI